MEWYKSDAAEMLAFGILIATVVLGGTGGYWIYKKAKAIDTAKQEFVLQERDLNSNKLTEQFYEINGKKCFLKIDGRNLESTLNE